MVQKKRKKKTHNVDKALNARHEVFCQLYAGCGERSYMSNGVMSYMQAFGIDAPTGKIRFSAIKATKTEPAQSEYWDYDSRYKSARSSATDLLAKPNIRIRIHTLFKILFSNETIDNELLKAIMQMEDWKAKVQAIREFNELKGRITKKIKLSGGVKSNISDEQMKLIAEQVLKKGKKLSTSGLTHIK